MHHSQCWKNSIVLAKYDPQHRMLIKANCNEYVNLLKMRTGT